MPILLPKPKVAMYGLTSEAYKLASDLVDRSQVTIVDETLQTATNMDAAFLKKNPNLEQLMSEEPLLDVRPLERVLGDAQLIFFTPRLRRPSDESIVEAASKLRDLSKYLSKGVTFVNTLPTGPGGNSENIVMLEKQTGLKVGDSFVYAYMPLRPADPKPAAVSIAGGGEKSPLGALGFAQSSQNIFSAELEYVASVLELGLQSVTDIELAKKAREGRVAMQRGRDVYIDDFARYLYDLKAIQAREETGESISYLAGATVKSLENFGRYVVDEAREFLKEKELKASRTKINLLWTLDKYEMRSDRLQMAESIQQRLRDYVTDVELVPGSKLVGSSEVLDPMKYNLVVVCSAGDREFLKQVKKGRRNVEMTSLLATPSLKRE
ncbi:MAG: hypothetical protein LYZ69_06750 [Nitrososphaerales archaeon]|nr:hypothetical protein [Nitrososphaerales archaeon]